ncbi:MAG: MFS transporter [Pseudomonadota bacterium]|nr:MFS transporter [Pseudomonadota bacterium]
MQQAESANTRASEFKRGWPVVLTGALGVGIGAPIFALGIFIVPLSTAFGWTRAQISLASLCIVFGTISTAMLVGRMVDRFGARKIAIVSLIALALTYLGMTQITGNILTFYGALIVLSLAACGASPIIWTRGVALWFERSRGLAFGLTLSGAGIAGVVIPPLIGSLIAEYHWQAGYIGMAVIAAVAVIPVKLFFVEPADKAGEHKSQIAAAAPVATGLSLKEALRERQFWQLGVVNFFISCCTVSLLVHLVPLLTDEGLSSSLAAQFASLMGVAMIVGRFSTGYLIDRFHAPFVGAIYFILAALGVLLLKTILAMPSPNLTYLAIAVVGFGLASGAELEQVSFITSKYFGLKSYGQIYAAQFIVFQLAVGVGPMVAGRIFDVTGSYDLALTLCIGAFFGGGVIMALIGRPRRTEHAAVSLEPVRQAL